MSEQPLVTVVIPTWNRLALVQEAVASVIAQTYERWELIVVDDGSTDGTPDRLRELRDNRVRVLVFSHCGNVGRLRNLGAEAGSGELIAFLDSDDVWLPRKLERQVDVLRNSSAGWCYTRFELMDHGGRTVPMRAGQFRALDGSIVRELLNSEASVAVSTVLIRRSIFNAVGGFSEDPCLVLREDHDFHLRCASRAKVVAVPELAAKIREHPARSTNALAGPHERSALVYERFIGREPDSALTPLARRVWADHLADAGAERLASGEFGRAGGFFVRALRNGDDVWHLARALCRGVRRLWRLRLTRPS